MHSKLRIGLLLDSILLPAWAAAAIERVSSSNHAELALIVLHRPRLDKRPFLKCLWDRRNYLLYSIFEAVDKRLFLRGPDALAPLHAADRFSNVPVFEVEPVETGDGQSFQASDIEHIRSHRLDILFKLGFGRLQGNILSAARYGVWTYRWGDPCKIEDGLTGFWEVVRGYPETGAALQQYRADAEQALTLFESWFFTYPYSPARNRNYLLWAASSFLPRQVERLYRSGAEKYYQERKKQIDERPARLEHNTIPSNRMVLWILLWLVGKNLVEIFRRTFYREQWQLLFNLDPERQDSIFAFQSILPPGDRFWADPHVIYEKPNYYIFIEEYLYRTRRGRISVIELDQTGNYKPSTPILQEDYHLSFPCVFSWQGRYYMIPESSEHRTIELYECVKFADQWRHKLTLMKDVLAMDTTVFYTKGKWWLFTAMAEQEAAAPQVELFLFYSDELFTDQWHSHPMNPIVSDVKKARAAGSVYEKNGKLFRPSQYGSSKYGYGFDLNEVLTLSENEYVERTFTSVRPDAQKKIIGIHTYANQENLTVVDALVRRPKWIKPA